MSEHNAWFLLDLVTALWNMALGVWIWNVIRYLGKIKEVRKK